jgi:hypothetical protein
MKSIYILSRGADDNLPMEAERYPEAIVWHAPILARGILTALANIMGMLTREVKYPMKIMVEERMSLNANKRKDEFIEMTSTILRCI